MGWLDHSTNNIIMDAVLTDAGRQRLAKGGEFSIKKFSLSDDEVDYRLIKRYGRIVGKEKIEKNTPIFEALTNQNIAIKNHLISATPSPTTVSNYLPYLTASETVVSNLGNVSPKSDNQTVTVYLTYKNARNPTEFTESEFQVKLPGRFLRLDSADASASSPADDALRTTTYSVTSSNNQITLKLMLQPIDSTTSSVYGRLTSSQTRQINTYVIVEGKTLGTYLNIPVTIETK